MSDRLLLIDSDIFVVLAAADLLGEIASMLGTSEQQIRRLPALKSQIKPGKSLGRKLTEEQRTKVQSKAEEINAITDSPQNTSRLAELGFIENIDAGEALLIATVCEHSSFLLTTGDKRCLTALGTAPNIGAVRDLIRGRLISFESAIILLVRKLGAATVGHRLKPLADCHKTVDILFGTKDEFEDAECLRQLNSYLNDLVRQMGDNLLYPLD